MKIVQLHDKPYAVGFWWQIRSGSAQQTYFLELFNNKALLREARSRADDLKARNQEELNCVVLRPDQFGLGHCDLPNIPRVPSLAASLHPPIQAVQSFLGIFHLQEGWWVCGRSRGLISANGDGLFETEQEARNEARELRNYFDAACETVCCLTPEESDVYLLSHVQDEAAVCPLYPDTRHNKKWLWAGMGVLCLGLCLFGVKQFWDARMQETAIHSARQLMQGKDAHRREILADPGRHFEKGWLKTPPVTAVRDVCLPELLKVPLSGNGWALESASCRPAGATGLTLNWGHRPGAAYTRLPIGARLTSTRAAETRRKLTPLKVRGTDAPLMRQEDITARLYEYTRQISCRLKINWTRPEQKTVDEVEVTAPWVRGTWQMEAVPAGMLISGDIFLLLSMPGLTVTDIVFEKNWTLKGVVYATSR